MEKRIQSIREPVLNEEDAILLTRDNKAWHVSITNELRVLQPTIEGGKGEMLITYELETPVLTATKTPSTVDTEERLAKAQEVLKKRLEEEKVPEEVA